MPLFQNQGLVARLLSKYNQYATDGGMNQDRHSPWGELMVQSLLGATMHGLADEGSYFVASSSGQTPGGGVTLSPTAGNTFSATQGLFTLFNGDVSSGKNIYLDFVAIFVTTVSASTTLGQLAYSIDQGDRGSAGTTMTIRSTNGNIALQAPSIATPLTGQPTIAAASNAIRYLGRANYRASVGAIGDCFLMKFGVIEATLAGGLLTGTTAIGLTLPAPPIIVAPQQSFVINEWATSRAVTAFAGEVVAGWWER